MADYHPLITRAVSALEKDTAENRRALYERARAALVVQLRGTSPPLDEAEITRERLALEEAIRKVEVESARRAREAPRATPSVARAAESTRRDEAAKREVLVKRDELAKREEVLRLEEAMRLAEAMKSAPPAETPTIVPEPPASEPVQKPVEAESARKPAENEAAQKSALAESAEAIKAQPANVPALSLPRNEAGAMLDEALKEFREVVGPSSGQSEVARAAPPIPPPPAMRPTFASPSPPRPKQPFAVQPPNYPTPLQPAPHPQSALPQVDPLKALESFEPRISHEDWQIPAAETAAPMPAAEPAAPMARRGRDDVTPEPLAEPPYPPIVDRLRPPRSLRSYRRLVWMLIAFVVLAGGGAMAYWQGGAIVEATRNLVGSMRTQPTQAQRETTPTRPKNADRVGQPDAAPSPRTGPAAAQRAMLTTEPDANNPRGRDYVGRAVWRTETIPAAPGRAAEVAIKLDVEIPDRGFAMTWLIRRNTDATLPATHTIDIEFNLAPNSPLGRIADIKSMLMKQPGQVEGSPLWGHAQRSTPNYFLVGLSAVAADADYNLKLLKEQPAFDVALVFSNVGRAFLLIEKGQAGERVFAEAFAAWKQ